MVLLFRNMKIATLDDVDLTGKSILLRIDVNSPIKDGKILDISRFKAHVKTIKELAELNTRLVIMSHQGRPGKNDFISLEQHSKILSRLLGVNVEFVKDIIGKDAKRRIANLENGEILMLDNTRFLPEENVEQPMEALSRTKLVSELRKFFDYYVGDAFATSHRSQPSIAGFPYVMPSVAGRVMQDEVSALSRAFNGHRPITYFIGGTKLDDAVKIINHLIKTDSADYILTGGLVSLLILDARGYDVGTAKTLLQEKFDHLLDNAKVIAKSNKVVAPLDVVSELNDGNLSMQKIDKIMGSPKDIGEETLKVYSEILKDSKTIILRGPAGVIEDERFKKGTIRLAEASLKSNAFIIFGGGHFLSILEDLPPELRKKVNYISTGGGAVVYFLSGEPMPGIEALAYSYRKFFEGGNYVKEG
ncbi:MAG: phosphoglycerate kinase [Caldisphaeraceae archaeon]|nr:phosphoglycerate kinase [Caldisphaeraceae archaeon]MEB3692587.1 phosphoglycerate kinase [Caldisphaeraceae archaeon]MEB3797508.1 phosphoglycerate kinase [Caldisphaeraceae archaeon]